MSATQVRSVTSFVEDEMVHRGVRLELVDGTSDCTLRSEAARRSLWDVDGTVVELDQLKAQVKTMLELKEVTP